MALSGNLMIDKSGSHDGLSVKAKPQHVEIIAAGPGKRMEDGRVNPLDVKVGDMILFSTEYGGHRILMATGNINAVISKA